MADRNKKLKAAMAAVAYYLEQEAAANAKPKTESMWAKNGRQTNMRNRVVVQRRGRLI